MYVRVHLCVCNINSKLVLGRGSMINRGGCLQRKKYTIVSVNSHSSDYNFPSFCGKDLLLFSMWSKGGS